MGVVKEHLIDLLCRRYGEIAKECCAFDFMCWADEPRTVERSLPQAADEMPVPRPELQEPIDDVLFLAGTEVSADSRSIGKLNSAILAGEAAGRAAADAVKRSGSAL